MKTNIRQGRMTWRPGKFALIACFVVGLLAVIGGYQPASAQFTGNLNSFNVTSLSSAFHFNVNTTDVPTSGSANLNSLLNTASNNLLEVGWAPPPTGNPIVFQFTSAVSGFGGAAAGDLLKVYAIGAAYLTNDTGFSSDPTGVSATYTQWDGGTGDLTPNWAYGTHGSPIDYFGYANSNGYNSSNMADKLIYQQSGTLNGVAFTDAKSYGDFTFGGIHLVSSDTATYLGLDVFGDVTDSQGNVKHSNQTGHIRVVDFSTTPEGSSLVLLACGLVPLVGIKRFIRRRTSA